MIPSNLTNREVLSMVDIVIGHPRKYTAWRLNCSRSTIGAAHMSLYRKLHCKNVADLVRFAYGLIK